MAYAARDSWNRSSSPDLLERRSSPKCGNMELNTSANWPDVMDRSPGHLLTFCAKAPPPEEVQSRTREVARAIYADISEALASTHSIRFRSDATISTLPSRNTCSPLKSRPLAGISLDPFGLSALNTSSIRDGE